MSLVAKFKDLQSLSSGYKYIPFKNALQPYLVLFLISFFVFVNSINNEVAYDDEIVLHRNEFVMKGIKGIPSIITHDSYYSYYKQLGMENSLPAGRYRPLSFITFAIEQEFIGTIPDGIVRPDSWDINKNRLKDQFEDTNKDGIYNEYDFWVRGAHLRHFVNVLLYSLLIILIYHVLIMFLFSNSKDMIFAAIFLFALHPLHTEVVANIKSRDEILSLIFIFSTLFFSFKYINENSKKHFIYIVISMFFALMSKEYALFLFAFIPAIMHVFFSEINFIKDKRFWLISSLVILSSVALIKFFNSGTLIATPILFFYVGYLVSKNSKSVSSKIVYALGVSLILYLSIRFSATQHQVEISAFQNDIISNPYMYASPDQIWASKIAVWMRYIKLFFIPNPLILDYSYRSIPYSNFSSPIVWISILFYSFLIFSTIIAFIKKKSWSFGLLFLLGFFFPVSNVLIDIGATMGERLFFHSSLGACILLMMMVFKIIEKLESKNKKFVAIFLIVFSVQGVIYATLTIRRNPIWKNNTSLFTHDVKYVPENINLIYGSASSYYEMAFLPENKNKIKELINISNSYADAGIKVYPKHDQLYFTKARNYFAIDEFDSTQKYISIVDTMTPDFIYLSKLKQKLSKLQMEIGVVKFEKKDTLLGLKYLTKAVMADSNNIKALNNLAKAHFELGNFEKAIFYYNKSIEINPKNKIASKNIDIIKSKMVLSLGDKKSKYININELLEQLNLDKKNPEKWFNLGSALMETGSYQKALTCFQMTLQLQPKNKEAKEAVERIKKMGL